MSEIKDRPKKVNKLTFAELQTLEARLKKDNQENSKYFEHVQRRIKNFNK